MKFSTMIPVNYNDGTAVAYWELESVFRLFWDKFGGCTVDATADGYWKDNTGKLFTDRVRRLTVVVENNSQANLDYARFLVRRVGCQLGQKSMYFEHDVCGANIVEFLDIDPEEDFTAIPEQTVKADVSKDARDKAYLDACERDEREEHWFAHTEYPVCDWQCDVANGTTHESYREWCENDARLE